MEVRNIPHPISLPCLRPNPPEARQKLHQICHGEIHATLTGTGLARAYHTTGALRSHRGPAKFIARVASRPPGFHSTTPGPRRRSPMPGPRLLGPGITPRTSP